MAAKVKKDEPPVEVEVLAADEAPTTAIEAEAEQPERLMMEWGGSSWEIPTSLDEISIDAAEHFALLVKASQQGDESPAVFADVVGFVREILGATQYRRLTRGRKVRELNDFVRSLIVTYGGRSTGE